VSAAGFDVLDLREVGFEERYCRLARADVVVSVDGSHINHAYFAVPDGTPLVVLIPANRFTAVHGGVAHAMGMRFGCVVMDAAGDDTFANPDEVVNTVDLMTSARDVRPAAGAAWPRPELFTK
jgi:hypothetical protein